MKYFTTAVLALASAAFSVAQDCNGINCFTPPLQGYQTSAGSTVNLTWTPSTPGTVSLQLRDGNSAYLNNGTYIAQSIPNNGQYTWHVPQNIVRGDSYAIEIISDSDPSKVNYTPPFNIDSTVLYSSTSAGASSTAASTSGSVSGMTSTASMTTTTGSMTTSTGSASVTSGASLSNTASGTAAAQSTSHAMISTGAASRATAVAGLLGAVAFGALAL